MSGTPLRPPFTRGSRLSVFAREDDNTTGIARSADFTLRGDAPMDVKPVIRFR
jgi:hypothetical protein